MRMDRRLAYLVAAAAAALVLGGWGTYRPATYGGGSGGTGTTLSGAIVETGAVDGTSFTVVGKSKLPFDHLMAVQYRHLPGVAGEAAGFSDLALTFTDYFAGSSASHSASKLIAARELHTGDSLYVHVTITTAGDSTEILYEMERGYLIEHPVWKDGKTFCLMLSADDGHPSNLGWSAAAESMGFTYTLSPSLEDSSDGIGAPGMMTSADLATVASRGVEVAYTGNHHRPFGVASFTRAAGVTAKIAAYYDQTAIEAISGDLVLSQAIDLHYFSWRAAAILDSLGYTNARGGYWDGNDGVRGFSDSAPGNRAWDLGRPLSWYKPGTLFGYSSWKGEDSTTPVSAIFGTGTGPVATPNEAARDTIALRLRRYCNQSARNGFAPISIVIHGNSVTREDVENLIVAARAQGDIWITTHSEMAAWYKTHHTPRAAAPWMPYAQARGIAATDSIVWGPPLPTFTAGQIAAAETYIFSNSTTAVNTATYDHSYTDGMTKGTFLYQYPDSVYGNAAFVRSRYLLLPLSGTESMGWQAFNVDEIDAIDPDKIISANLTCYMNLSGNAEDATGGTQELFYFSVIGVTNPVLFEGMDESDTSLNDSDESADTPWSVNLTTYAHPHDFGDFVYGDYVLEGANTTHWITTDVTEYIRYVVDNNLYAAGFCWWGRAGGEEINLAYCHTANALSRPYLVVTVAP